MRTKVEMVQYHDHAFHPDIEDLKKVFEGDFVITTIGANIRETKTKLFLLSDIMLERHSQGATFTMSKCSVNEIMKGDIISRHKLADVEIEGI